jgi:hypothetical protein
MCSTDLALRAGPGTARTEPGAAPVVVRVAVVHSFGPLTQTFTVRVAAEP